MSIISVPSLQFAPESSAESELIGKSGGKQKEEMEHFEKKKNCKKTTEGVLKVESRALGRPNESRLEDQH